VRQQIQRFGVGQTAKVFGILYALMGACFVPIFALVAIFGPSENTFGLGLSLALPLLYGAMGFVFTAIACAIYNVVAGWVGGIEVEIGTEAPPHRAEPQSVTA
jgi:hypothetical protein